MLSLQWCLPRILFPGRGWAALIRSICVHGKSGSDKYNNIRLGVNSRLDTLQAAILLPKLEAFQKHELDAVNQAAATVADALMANR